MMRTISEGEFSQQLGPGDKMQDSVNNVVGIIFVKLCEAGNSIVPITSYAIAEKELCMHSFSVLIPYYL